MTERMMGKVPVTFNILTMDSQTPVHWWAVDSHTRCDAGEGHFPPQHMFRTHNSSRRRH